MCLPSLLCNACLVCLFRLLLVCLLWSYCLFVFACVNEFVVRFFVAVCVLVNKLCCYSLLYVACLVCLLCFGCPDCCNWFVCLFFVV